MPLGCRLKYSDGVLRHVIGRRLGIHCIRDEAVIARRVRIVRNRLRANCGAVLVVERASEVGALGGELESAPRVLRKAANVGGCSCSRRAANIN